MKTIGRIFLILFISVALIHLSETGRAEEISKTVKKNFEVNEGAKLLLNNSFGTITCYNWEKPEISVEATITVNARSEEKAAKLMDGIKVTVNGSASQVEARTTIRKGKNIKGSMSIDYIIYMPPTIDLDLVNKFGDVTIEEVHGTSRFNVEYGNAKVERLSHGDNLIDVQFGAFAVESMKGAVVILGFSKFNLGYSGSLRLKSTYSELNIEKVILLDGIIEGGQVKIEEVDVLTIEKASHANVYIENLNQKLDVSGEFCNVEIEELSSDIESIVITSKYGNYKIPIHGSTGFTIDAKSHFGGIQLPDRDATFSYMNTSDTDQTFKGTIGENPTAMVKIRSEFGNISLK